MMVSFRNPILKTKRAKIFIMKKALKWIGIILLIAFIIIQFFPKNYPENQPVTENDIITHHNVSDDIASILKTSCYDCHSNQTTYPWYSKIAPVSFLLKHDIEEGRGELNFSEWGTYDVMDKIDKLDELVEETQEGKMPLPIYTFMHGHAKLSDSQKEQIEVWANSLMEEIISE